MCAGAVLTLADVVTVLMTLGGVRWAAAHDLGAGQWPFVMLTQADFWLASAPIGAGVWLWLAWANGRGYHWARSAFVAFFSVLTVVPFFGLSGDALPYTGADVLATGVLWLVALVVMALIFSQTASRYYQRRAAMRAATAANGTGR
jgi:predicted neutral ceramidase superfamily lipid hydrolase